MHVAGKMEQNAKLLPIVILLLVLGSSGKIPRNFLCFWEHSKTKLLFAVALRRVRGVEGLSYW